jgi:predicted DCC family thiol-disulfide oxidoreductase YuxK
MRAPMCRESEPVSVSTAAEPTVIVYDGECPFCSSYVRLLRLRHSIGPVRLVDARSPDPLVEDLRAAGIDLDEGMVLKIGGRIYHGDECVHMLALLSTPVGLFNRMNAALFRSRTASRALYPVLRTGRNAILRLLGRSKMGCG